MAFQTEVFQGDFNIDATDVSNLTSALEKLLGISDKVTESLNRINLKSPKIDTAGFDSVVKAAEATAEKVTKTLGKALSLQDVKKQTGFDDITAIIQGQLASIPEKSQPIVFKLKEQFSDLKKQIGNTFDGDNIDLTAVDALKAKFAALAVDVRKITEMQSGDAIDAAIKKVDILANQGRVANESIGAGIGKIATGLSSITQARGLSGLLNSLERVRDGAVTVGNSFSNVKAGIDLATRDGGNLFLGVRQAIFGVSSSTNVAARALDFLAATFTKTTQSSDKLLISAQKITSQIASFNNDMALASTALKDVAKQEGLNLAALNKLDAQIIDVAKQYTRLDDVIKGGNKITPTQLSQVQNKSEQLLRTIDNLVKSGFVPLDSTTGKTLLGMRDKFLDNVQAGKVLEAQVKAIDAAQAKEAETTTKTKKAFQTLGDTAKGVFDRVKASIGGAFTGATPAIDKTKSAVSNLNSEMQKTNSSSRIIETTLGTLFGHTIYGLLSKATGTVANFFGLFTKNFVQSNNLVQNFDITLRQMMSGLDSGQIDSAIGNITDFIKEKVAKTPFELADAFQSFQRLATAGLDPKKWLTPVADAAAAVNKPMEQLIGALQRIQIGAKGIGIDMLRDFGIPVNQVGSYVDKATGATLTLDEVFKKNGDITKLSADQLAGLGIEFKRLEFDKQGALVNDVSDAMGILNGYLQQNTTFAGAAEARSRSLSGVMSNFRDVITNLTVQFGQPIFEKLTTGGQALLNAIGFLQPQLERLALVIGTGIANAFDFVSGKINLTDTFLRSLATGIANLTSFVEAVFAGEWQTAWGMFLSAVDSGVNGVFGILDGFAQSGLDWGFSFVEQIANGIFDAAASILQSAVNYVAETIASFMQPGSPPEKGPLNTINTWGSGLMDTLTGSMNKVDTGPLEQGLGRVKNVFDKFDLGAAESDVAAIQQRIIEAEAEGFVPADLRKQLQLAQDKVELIKAQANAQDKLNQEEAASPVAEGAQKTKGAGGAGGKAEGAHKVAVEKKTAEQVRTEALAILDQQLKDGVIKYEDYAKERLKIEEKFYEDTLKEGGKVSDQNVAAIKQYQEEVEKFREKTKKTQDTEAAALSIPSGRDILAGFADLPGKIGKVGERSAYALSEHMSKVLYKSFDDIKLNITNRIAGLGTTLKTKLATLFGSGNTPLVAFTGGDQEASTFDNLLAKITTFVTYTQTNLPLVQATFLTVWEVVKSSAIAAFEVFKSTYESSLKPSLDQLTSTLGSLGITWPQVFDALKASTGIVFSVIAAVIIGAIGIIVGLVNAVATGVSYMISGFQTLGAGIGQVITGITQVLTSIMFFVTNIFQGNFILAFSGIMTFFEGLKNIGAGLVNVVIGLFTTLVGTVYGLIKGFVTGVIGFFSNLYQQLVGGSIVPELVEMILELITSLKDRGIALISETVGGWIRKFADSIGKFKQIGTDIINGLLKGINESKDKVIEVLKQLAADAIASAASALGITSPSVRFAELGVNVIEGFNKGLESRPVTIGSIVQQAADEVEEFLEKSLEGSTVKAALKRFKQAFKDNFDDIIKYGGGPLLEKLSGVLGATGIKGGDQGKVIKQAAELFVSEASKQLETQPAQFAQAQQKVLDQIGKLQQETLSKFNQQLFNIRSASTEARIELERLFNRTVTDDEVAAMAKVFEGTPVEQLGEQEKLILRNYQLQQKLTGATQQELMVRQSLAKAGTITEKAKEVLASFLPPEKVKIQAQAAGNSILKALGLGMDAGAEDVLSRLGVISENIMSQVEAAFGIASPSTVMMGYGENLSAGLANGITKGLGKVDGAMALMQQAVNPAANLKVGKIGGGFDFAGAGAGQGQGLQLIQYNTIGDEFDMATFTTRTQQAIVELLRTGR